MVASFWQRENRSGPREAAALEPLSADAEPRAFFEGHAFGAKGYHTPSDRDALVAPMFHTAAPTRLGSCGMPVRSPCTARWR